MGMKAKMVSSPYVRSAVLQTAKSWREPGFHMEGHGEREEEEDDKHRNILYTLSYSSITLDGFLFSTMRVKNGTVLSTRGIS